MSERSERSGICLIARVLSTLECVATAEAGMAQNHRLSERIPWIKRGASQNLNTKEPMLAPERAASCIVGPRSARQRLAGEVGAEADLPRWSQARDRTKDPGLCPRLARKASTRRLGIHSRVLAPGCRVSAASRGRAGQRRANGSEACPSTARSRRLPHAGRIFIVKNAGCNVLSRSIGRPGCVGLATWLTQKWSFS